MKKLTGLLLLLTALFPSQAILGQVNHAPPVKTTLDFFTLRKDTLRADTLTEKSHVYHPLYTHFPAWFELGNLGFPALPAYWQGMRSMNEPHYLTALKPYAQSRNSLHFYDTYAPYALLAYSSGGADDVNGQVIHAKFARHVSPELKIAAFLDFINSPGHYTNQAATQSDFTLNAEYTNERYHIVAGVENLQFKLGENGGLQEPIGFPWNTTSPANRPVNLRSGASNTSWTVIKGRQEFDFFAPRPVKQLAVPSADSLFVPDSLFVQDSAQMMEMPPPGDSIALPVDSVSADRYRPRFFHAFIFQHSNRLYKDEQSPDNSIYDRFYISDVASIDSVNIRHYNNKIGWVQSFALNENRQIQLQTGLSHQYTSWISNNLALKYQQLGLFATVDGSVSGWAALLQGEFRFLGPGWGSYDLSLDLATLLFEKWKFRARLGSMMDLPAISYQVYSGNHDRWMNRMKKQSEQFVKFNGRHLKSGIETGASLSLISNWAYFDTLAMPQQTNYSSVLSSLFIQKKFSAGPFTSDNLLYLQYSPAKEIPLPMIVASSSNFMHHDIFFPSTGGVLELEYGIDLRYVSAYRGYAYQPSSGAFYIQNQTLSGNYPYADLFLTLRVKRTRFFLKWEHVNGGFTGDGFFPVMHYPVKVRVIKYGLYWHFYD